MAKITDKNTANLKPAWKKGETGNPNGRPKGRKNFATLFDEAIRRIAESKGIEPEEFEIQLVQQAITKGFNGDRSFYSDTMDRVHGKAIQPNNLTGEVKLINVVVPPEVAKTFEINATHSETSGSDTEQV